MVNAIVQMSQLKARVTGSLRDPLGMPGIDAENVAHGFMLVVNIGASATSHQSDLLYLETGCVPCYDLSQYREK